MKKIFLKDDEVLKFFKKTKLEPVNAIGSNEITWEQKFYYDNQTLTGYCNL